MLSSYQKDIDHEIKIEQPFALDKAALAFFGDNNLVQILSQSDKLRQAWISDTWVP